MFHYTTDPVKPSPQDLVGTSLLTSSVFHIPATPAEISIQNPELLHLRSEHGITKPPFIAWEPFPGSYIPLNLDAFLQACRHVDVFSPNHLELSALFNSPRPRAFKRSQLEVYDPEFTDPGGAAIVVVRCGEHGSLTTQTTECATEHISLQHTTPHAQPES